jgi:hypothetical protein
VDIETMVKRANEAKARAAAATEDPWLQGFHVGEPRAIVAAHEEDVSLLALDRDGMAVMSKAVDAAFVVAARRDVPELADDVLALVAEVSRLREADEARDPRSG